MAADEPDVMMQVKPEIQRTSPVGEEKVQEVALAPDAMLIKHPLQNTWTLWFFKMEGQKTWEESQMEIATFSTVEDFWALYNHIQVASGLKNGCDYSLFKQGIKPMWEDGRNKFGGRWLISLDKQHRYTDLDRFWLDVLLLMIGEAFEEYSDEVCGAVVNIRGKQDKIGVWTRDFKNGDGILRIGHVLKEQLRIPRQTSIGYQAHSDTMVKSGSVAKNRYNL